MLNGKVISLRIFEKKGSTGRRMPAIRFADHAGIIGDVHYGERDAGQYHDQSHRELDAG